MQKTGAGTGSTVSGSSHDRQTPSRDVGPTAPSGPDPQNRPIPGYLNLPLYEKDPVPEFTELPDGHAPAPWHGRALRVALAMKGGLSLAVWIGGAIAELDVLRRVRIYRDASGDRPHALFYHVTDAEERDHISPHLLARATTYARLLASRGYDRVEFDVMAGASAGGLNAVLYGIAQRAGVGFDGILETWVQTGSAWGLLQTGEQPAFDSIMRGDDYFWPEVTRAIDQIVRRRAERSPLRSENVVVDLSATLIDAVDSSDSSAVEGRAQFRFVGEANPKVRGRGIPGDHTADDYREDVARIAYAARTTSSFPGIFEPALIYSGNEALSARDGWPGPRSGETGAIDSPDMRMVFNAHRPDAARHPFHVVDGGVLDNIPIDRALNAVRNLPASEHINRAILYLDPSPKEADGLFRRAAAYAGARPALHWMSGRTAHPVAVLPREDAGSRLLGAVGAAMRKRTVKESSDEEVDEVDLVRAAVSVAKARHELLAVRIDGTPLTEAELEDAQAAYARYRTIADFDMLTPVFRHPGEWLLGTDLHERPAFRSVNRRGIVHLETAFREAGERASSAEPGVHPRAIATGWQSLFDASLAAIAWIRAIEHAAFHGGDLRRLDEALEDDARARVRRDLHDVLADVRNRRDHAILRTIREMQPHLCDESLGDDEAAEVVQRWQEEDVDDPAAREKDWARLGEVVDRLRVISQQIPRLSGHAGGLWRRSPWSEIAEQEAPGKTMAKQLPLIFGGSGIPQPISSVRFHRIGSDVRPHRPRQFARLLEDQLLRGYRALLARPVDELDGVTVSNHLEECELRSTAKLAGLRVANMAGFLSGDWRRNDWWWGRLDASAGTVEFLTALPVITHGPWAEGAESGPSVPPVDEARAHVQDQLLLQLDRDDRPPYRRNGDAPASDPDVVRQRLIRGAQGLEALSEPYRVAIASRAVRNSSAALARGERLTSPRRAAHWVLRPFLALAPAVLSPPRMILVGAALAAAAILIWPVPIWPAEWERFDLGPNIHNVVAVAAAAALGLLVVLRLIGAAYSRRRHDVEIDRSTPTKPMGRLVIERARRLAGPRRLVLVLATLACYIGTVVLAALYGMASVVFWLAVVLLFAIGEAASRALQTVPTTFSRRSPWPILLAILGAAVIVTVALVGTTLYAQDLADFAARPGDEGDWWLAGARGLSAAAIGTILACVLLARCFTHDAGNGLVSRKDRTAARRRQRADRRFTYRAAKIEWRGRVRTWRKAARSRTATERMQPRAPKPERPDVRGPRAPGARVVVLTALGAGVTSGITSLAFQSFPTTMQQLTQLVVVGWVTGTVLWFLPWRRGAGTDLAHAPTDAVDDAVWRPVAAEYLEPSAIGDVDTVPTGERRLNPAPA